MTTSFDRLQFGPSLDIAARSFVGAGPGARAENQDNFLLVDTTGLAHFLHGQEHTEQRIPGWTAGHARIAVLDGMGGHGQGREAAEAVVAGLLALPPLTSIMQLSHQLDALHTTLQHTFALDCPAARRPGTTLTMLELPAEQAGMLYHVGDSRLYELREGRISVLTVDHVPATSSAMGGELGEDEWWSQVHGEHRSQISQAFILGNAFTDPAELADPLFPLSPDNLPPYLRHLSDRRALELRPGALYLLATDGFWSCADPGAWVGSWPAILAGSACAKDACDRLFTAMLERPPPNVHPDNLTTIVLRPRASDETALPVLEKDA